MLWSRQWLWHRFCKGMYCKVRNEEVFWKARHDCKIQLSSQLWLTVHTTRSRPGHTELSRRHLRPLSTEHSYLLCWEPEGGRREEGEMWGIIRLEQFSDPSVILLTFHLTLPGNWMTQTFLHINYVICKQFLLPRSSLETWLNSQYTMGKKWY